MFIPKINYSTWYLKYRGVDAGIRASELNTEIRELCQFKNYDRVKLIQIRWQCVGFDGKWIIWCEHGNNRNPSIQQQIAEVNPIQIGWHCVIFDRNSTTLVCRYISCTHKRLFFCHRFLSLNDPQYLQEVKEYKNY